MHDVQNRAQANSTNENHATTSQNEQHHAKSRDKQKTKIDAAVKDRTSTLLPATSPL
jgi:hypothetical protein